MAGQFDIYLSGDAQSAKNLVARVLAEQGFAVETNPGGGFSASRGSAGLTIAFGGLAGKNLQMTFFVEFLPGPDGALDARISRNTAASALKGGAIGATRTNNAFIDVVNAIGAAATTAGIFAGSVGA